VAVLVAGTGVAILCFLGQSEAFLYIFSARCRGDKIKKPLFLFRRPTLPGHYAGSSLNAKAIIPSATRRAPATISQWIFHR
jgi:hypothetical protein